MYKIMLYGSTKKFLEIFNLLNCFKDKFEIIGFCDYYQIYDELYGIKCIKKDDIKNIDYDYVILLYENVVLDSNNVVNFSVIFEDALSNGILEEQILSYRFLLIPNINFDKYLKLVKSNLTIFSNNCWGGIIYNYLGLKFRSPLIDLFIDEDDYIKFLGNPKKYLDEELVFDSFFQNDLCGVYPIGKLGDITIHFLHCSTFEEAYEKWNKRVKEVNFDNIFVMMYSLEPYFTNELDKMEYNKKICFLPIENDLDFCYSFKDEDNLLNYDFWNYSILNAHMEFPIYNIIDLLLEGNFNKVSKVSSYTD